MGNNTSISQQQGQSSDSRNVTKKQHDQQKSSSRRQSLASNRINKRLMGGAIVNKRSTPTLSSITRLEAKGEITRSGNNNNNNNFTDADEEYFKERQRSIVSSQGSDATANDVSIASTTSTSSLSSISSSSMVDADDDNIFQHIEEIDKDIEYEHIEGVGLSGGDDIPRKNQDEKLPVIVKWPKKGNEREVHIIGDFTSWKKKLKLNESGDFFKITLNLPKGLYKIQFLINNREMKISDQLPMATDNEGNIVNWFEVDNKEDFSISEPTLRGQLIPESKSYNNNSNVHAPLEAGSIENRRLGKKTMSLDHLLKNVVLSPSSEVSTPPGQTTPSAEPPVNRTNSPASQVKNFPYNTNQRHISNQSTISGLSLTNDSSSVNSVSTYHYKAPERPKLQYTSELPDIYYKEELSYPYPSGDMDSASYYKQINFDEYLSDKLELPTPPELPLYLGSLLINDDHTGRHSKNNKLNDLNVDKYSGLNYSGLDNIPNHVILKHLITTNIKNNVMMVTVINRYQGKYVYQALYSPVNV